MYPWLASVVCCHVDCFIEYPIIQSWGDSGGQSDHQKQHYQAFLKTIKLKTHLEEHLAILETTFSGGKCL